MKFSPFSQTKLGSSLSLPALGGLGQGQHFFFLRRILRSKIQIPSASKARARRKGGVGGIPPRPSRSPAALLVQSRTQQKSFLFLLEEKIRRAQIKKCEGNFFAGWRAS